MKCLPLSSDLTRIAVRQSEAETGAIVAVPRTGVDLEALEHALIAFALEATHGNRSRAARFLGLTRSALLYRMQKYRVAGNSPCAGPGPAGPGLPA